MKEIIRSLRYCKAYVSVMAVFFIAFAVMQVINKRFWLHDFQVYYDAATNFFSGNAVYGIAYGLGSGYYKYSPFALFAFFPLTLIPFDGAKVIYFVFLAVLIILAVILSDKLVRDKLFNVNPAQPRSLILFLITGSFLQHIYYELHLGNINILLLLLSLTALYLVLKGKEWAAGAILALAIMIKPHFLILIPLFLLRKRLKVLISCIFSIVSALLIPSLYTGFKKNLQLLGEWKDTIMVHNDSPVKGQDTIYSWLYRITGSYIPEAEQYIFVIAVLGFIALMILAFYMLNKRRESKMPGGHKKGDKNFIFEFLVLVALIPNLTVTDSEHFLFSVPLIAWVINYLFLLKPGYLLTSLSVIILFMYGGNLREVVGANLSKWMTAQGILGLGNLFLIGFSIYLMLMNPKKAGQINIL